MLAVAVESLSKFVVMSGFTVTFCNCQRRYCFKAPDRVNVELNEIQAYLSGRLLSCSEAVFRILGLRLHQEWPSVERLDLHLPLQNNVVFNPMDDPDDIMEQLPRSTSKLLQWFVLNGEDLKKFMECLWMWARCVTD